MQDVKPGHAQTSPHPKIRLQEAAPSVGLCAGRGAKLSSQNRGEAGLLPPPPQALSLPGDPRYVARLWLVDLPQRATPKCPGEVPTSASGSCRSQGWDLHLWGGFWHVLSRGGRLCTLESDPPAP